jgi:photosystem II stability/assembly factor-like uncharacterized protein
MRRICLSGKDMFTGLKASEFECRAASDSVCFVGTRNNVFHRILFWLAFLGGMLSHGVETRVSSSELVQHSAPTLKPYQFRDLFPLLRGVALTPDGQRGFAVGSGGVILHLENGKWDRIQETLTNSDLTSVSISADGQHGFAVGTPGTILLLENGEWEMIQEGLTPKNLTSVSISADGQHGFAVGSGGMILHLENGKWERFRKASLRRISFL